MRTWHKTVPMKLAHEHFGIYNGTWAKLMDRYWESNDGYHVSSRQLRTEWGVIEHVTIGKMGMKQGDIPWAVKQEIKEELFGVRAVAIEVFPAKKNLVDVMDLYHLWILPKDFRLPFGIHPTRDPLGEPVERGYDFDLQEANAWNESEERRRLYDSDDVTIVTENGVYLVGERRPEADILPKADAKRNAEAVRRTEPYIRK